MSMLSQQNFRPILTTLNPPVSNIPDNSHERNLANHMFLKDKALLVEVLQMFVPSDGGLVALCKEKLGLQH